MPKQVSYCDVLPCPNIGDHDAPYVCMNVRVTRFTPRYKYIRDERNFDEGAFIEDLKQLPFSIVYSTDDPEMQLEMLNKLLRDCIDRHAPLKRTKVTRPPAPWLKQLDIQKLHQDCRSMRTQARKDMSDSIWNSFRDKRNQLKAMIGKAKREFYNKALSSSKPKEVWKIIHRILHPNPQPLRFDPDELNTHFATTAERVTGATPTSADSISNLIQALPEDEAGAFVLKPVTCLQVLTTLKNLRSDCSCGPDGIPVKFIKYAADHLASPLTYILNTCISLKYFPSAWKVARISPIPKQADVKDRNDLRPISILPVLSKVYERLVLGQMSSFVSSGPDGILGDTVSAYRKGHSTTTSLLAIKDDITKAMKRGEITMAVLADFSKAFDTVAYEVVLKKLHRLGFSKSFLMWVTSYVTGRKQFVQIDDKASRSLEVCFGVPQGSVLGPVLFNLYVNDLAEHLSPVRCHQYADDTTFYAHAKPRDISECERRLQFALDRLSSWSSDCNLALNPKKTKTMLFSTAQMARYHNLDEHQVLLTVNGQPLERVQTTRLLGTEVQQNLKWHNDFNSKISSCYSTLSVLRKLKNLAPLRVRKLLAETLVLSKIDFNDVVTHPAPDYLLARLQRVQLAAAGFVLKRYASLEEALELGWLPIVERREFHLASSAYKAVHYSNWPTHLQLRQYIPGRTLRSSSDFKLSTVYTPDTFGHNASSIFNSLPTATREAKEFSVFKRNAKRFFNDKAKSRL